ncbi:MAG: DUF3108 domain-containing protein [Candidatus Kapaibacteriales bacterium]
MVKKFLVPLSIVIIGFVSLYSQTSKMFSVGEEILYEVSFFGIKLGTIKIVTEAQERINNKLTFRTKAYIDSYEGIPFLSLHGVFTSWVDPSATFSHKFYASMKEKDYWLFDQNIYDYVNKKIIIEKYKKNEKFFSRTIFTEKKWNDGFSLFFLAREFVNSKKNIRIPTVIDRDTFYTYINFLGKKENVEIRNVKYPIRTVNFNGKASWTGIYGLTGYFEGWFSDDEARIPIKAKMNVYIGSIYIELIRWKRADWVPPKG